MNNILKITFHLLNIILILFYIYPGSIVGWIVYQNLEYQPQISREFIVSLNHFFAFILLSLLGILSYLNNKKLNFVIKYLFLLSIILELSHILIPKRSFELSDLFGNMLGVVITFTVYKIWKKI